MVECDLAKVEVAGSNPVSRSNLLSRGSPAKLRTLRCGPDALRPLRRALSTSVAGPASPCPARSSDSHHAAPNGAVAKW